MSEKSRIVDALLCVLLGGLGIHGFYECKIGTGIPCSFTASLCGIGWLVDFILSLCCRDKNGLPITKG